MNIPPAFLADANAMPKVLRELLEAELAAGNEIKEVFHCFPAPPAGACFRLARPVTTRPHDSSGGIDFYDRNASNYSGEFTDAKRFYFIIEPPHPTPAEPDMDAIRAARDQRIAASMRFVEETGKKSGSKSARKRGYDPRDLDHLHPDPLPPVTPTAPEPESAVRRFERSMIMNYEKWHDGIGYDLEILKTATPEELVEIEQILLRHGIDDWRDVEALAALDSPRARVMLRKALKSKNHEIATAVVSHAPHLLSDDERTDALVKALESSTAFEGLSQTLLEVEEFHPPKVVEALLRGVLKQDGETAVHLAAMLMFLHGKASSSFDWDLRPFFLEFNTEDRKERKRLYRELCKKIGIQPLLIC